MATAEVDDDSWNAINGSEATLAAALSAYLAARTSSTGQAASTA